jgi:hypothetical protein
MHVNIKVDMWHLWKYVICFKTQLDLKTVHKFGICYDDKTLNLREWGRGKIASFGLRAPLSA